MSEVSTQIDPVTKVARDLTEIEDMAARLEEQAIHKANAGDIPGGAAMVALAHVANLEAWGHVFETEERQWWDDDERDASDRPERDDDPDDAPPLQDLLYWSEAWRREHGYELDGRPTILSEANYLRWSTNWAWQNEPHFEDYADDVRKAKRKLENILYAGIRVERGAPCLYGECKGARIIRKIDHKGERTDWFCPKCERSWNEERYASMVTAANEAAKFEQIGDEMWCTVDYAARAVKRGVKTIRSWVNDGKVSEACIISGRRMRFVNLGEVREQNARAARRVRGAA